MQIKNPFISETVSSNPTALEVDFDAAWQDHTAAAVRKLNEARNEIGRAIMTIQKEVPGSEKLLVKAVRKLGLDMPISFSEEDAEQLWSTLKTDPRFQTFRTCSQIQKDHDLLPEEWDCLADMADQIFDTEGDKRSKKYRMRF